MSYAANFDAAPMGVSREASAAPATPAAPARKAGTMGKIFLIVGLAIFIFLAFTTYSVQKEIQGSAQLAAIKDLYFPVLQRLDADIVRVDKMEELYIQVVVAGDRDSLGKANELGNASEAALAEAAKLYPERAASIEDLRKKLKKYEELASHAATAFLDQTVTDPQPLTDGMNQALSDLRKGMQGFRNSTYEAFSDTLAGSEHDGRVRLFMGLALGVMNLGFMAVLVYFIRNNMKMMQVIEVQNATLEHRVAERTAQLSQKTSDINAMLQNMKQGVATVIPGNRIHPEYSNYLTTIFCIDNLGGRDLVESLFGRSSLGVDVKDQVSTALAAILGEEAMMFDFNGHLLPREMQIEGADGAVKIVQMDWSPITNEQGSIEKVLLITQDVTHLRELELSSAKQKEELDIIANLIRVPAGKFNDFVGSAQKFIAANRELLRNAKGKDPEAIAALFRNMHTIKGNARTFQFTHITNAAHSAEQTYDRLRKDPAAEWNADQMLVELDQVAASLAQYVEVNEEKLGRKGRAEDLMTGRGAFVSNEQLAHVRSLAAAVAEQASAAELKALRTEIDQLGLSSLRRIVSSSSDSLASLAAELKKPAPAVEVAGAEVSVNGPFAEAFKSSFVHILRNSLDHGIESPEERTRAGKPERGTVRLTCKPNDAGVEIHIQDDGRGLALHRLYEKGLAAGIFKDGERPAPDSVAEIIFRSGLSTSEHVTQVSGRGVGMEAVRTFLREQGASIRIALNGGAGGDFTFTPFEFVIDVPATALKHPA